MLLLKKIYLFNFIETQVQVEYGIGRKWKTTLLFNGKKDIYGQSILKHTKHYILYDILNIIYKQEGILYSIWLTKALKHNQETQIF